MGQRSHHEMGRIDRAAVRTDPPPWPHAPSMKILDQQPDRTQREIAAEDGSNLLGLFLDDDELLGAALVTQRHRTADPDALALGRRDLVPHPLADHLPLDLRER